MSKLSFLVGSVALLLAVVVGAHLLFPLSASPGAAIATTIVATGLWVASVVLWRHHTTFQRIARIPASVRNAEIR